MNNMANVKVHLRTRRGNVNLLLYRDIPFYVISTNRKCIYNINVNETNQGATLSIRRYFDIVLYY